MANNNTPQLRFAGFEGEWTITPLNNFVKRVTRKNTNLESDLTMTISAHHGLISQMDFFNKRIASTDLSGYYLMKNGEFTYNKSYSSEYPWGAVKRLDRYNQGVVSNLYIVFSHHDIDSDYLVSYYNTSKWHREVAVRAKEGARNHGLLNISAEEFFSTAISVPKTENEQKMVGSLIKDIEKKIKQQRELCDKLRKLKSALLDKLFPKNGASEPELRLDGFSEPWQKKCLSEIVNPYIDVVPTPTDSYTRLGIRSHGKGTFHEFVPKGSGLETTTMWVVDTNNLIVNITFGWELAVAITDDEDKGKLVSHRFPQFSFNQNHYPLFYKYALINDSFRKHLVLASPGSAGRNRVLKVSQMLEYHLYTPSYDEQMAIANILSDYDRLIDFNETKLLKLRNLKSAMLDKLFV